MTLIQVKSSYFCAGIEIEEYYLYVKRAAPIIKYMKGWNIEKVEAYAAKKGWTLEYL